MRRPFHRDQTGFAARRALLAVTGLAATGAGFWLALHSRDRASGEAHPSGPQTASDRATRAQAGAPSAPVVQNDRLTEAFWAQRFDRPGGGTLAMSAYRGRPMLLNFWATWCPPCVKEMPELERFRQTTQAEGWHVVGLAVDGPTPVKEFLGKTPVSFDVGLAGFEGTELSQALGNDVGGLPFSVIIDGQGRIRHRKMGATRLDELEAWAKGI